MRLLIVSPALRVAQIVDGSFGSLTARASPVAVGIPDVLVRVHFWLLPPLQVHSSIGVPAAVPLPVASRHRPDCTPMIVPSALTRHCWFAPPLQLQISTLVPGAVSF